MRVLALIVLLSLGLVAAGCGGGGSPSVASLGAGTTTDSASSASPAAGSSSSDSGSGGAGGGELKMVMGKSKDGAKFAACMRKNGVPNFPDPGADGSISIDSSSGINPRSPKFQQASQTCRKLLPNGGQPTPQEQAQIQQKMLAFAQCMRAHGIKDFPDPNFSGGHGSLQLKGGPGSDLNPTSPSFQRAQNACKGDLPGGKGGLGPVTAGGK